MHALSMHAPPWPTFQRYRLSPAACHDPHTYYTCSRAPMCSQSPTLRNCVGRCTAPSLLCLECQPLPAFTTLPSIAALPRAMMPSVTTPSVTLIAVQPVRRSRAPCPAPRAPCPVHSQQRRTPTRSIPQKALPTCSCTERCGPMATEPGPRPSTTVWQPVEQHCPAVRCTGTSQLATPRWCWMAGPPAKPMVRSPFPPISPPCKHFSVSSHPLYL